MYIVKKILENAKEILEKLDYSNQKILGKKTWLEQKAKDCAEIGVFPSTINRYSTKVGGLTINIFQSILSSEYFKFGGDYSRYQCGGYLYIGDHEKKLYSLIQTTSKIIDGFDTSNVIGTFDRSFDNLKVICFSKHYIDRFKERNKGFIAMAGNNLNEALVVDLLSTNVYFLNPKLGFGSGIEDELVDVLESVLKGSSELFEKYINCDEGVSVKKTLSGYGIFSNNGPILTMITWLNKSMLSKEQLDFFSLITSG